MRRLGQLIAVVLLLILVLAPLVFKRVMDNPTGARIALPALWHLRIFLMSLDGRCLVPDLCYQEDATEVEASLLRTALAAHGRHPGHDLRVTLRHTDGGLQILLAVPEGEWRQGDLIRDVTLAAKDLRPGLSTAPDIFLTGSDWLPRRFIPSECTTRGAGCSSLAIPEGAPIVPHEQVPELPIAAGGALSDGTYVLTGLNAQGSEPWTGGPARGVLQVAGNVLQSATTFNLDRVQYLDCQPDRETYSIRVSGNQLIAKQTCPADCPGGCETTFGFSALGSALTLIAPGQGAEPAAAMTFTSH